MRSVLQACLVTSKMRKQAKQKQMRNQKARFKINPIRSRRLRMLLTRHLCDVPQGSAREEAQRKVRVNSQAEKVVKRPRQSTIANEGTVRKDKERLIPRQAKSVVIILPWSAGEDDLVKKRRTRQVIRRIREGVLEYVIQTTAARQQEGGAQ